MTDRDYIYILEFVQDYLPHISLKERGEALYEINRLIKETTNE